MVTQAKAIELTPWQIDNLSRPLVKRVFEEIEAFYSDPVNENGFREWLKNNPASKTKGKE